MFLAEVKMKVEDVQNNHWLWNICNYKNKGLGSSPFESTSKEVNCEGLCQPWTTAKSSFTEYHDT